MRESVEREFVVEAPRAEVWPRLTDVPAVASCLPILHSITQRSPGARGAEASGLDGGSYSAAFEDRAGPFALRADMRIEVAEVREPELVVIRARGEDRRARSRIMIDAEARLSEAGPDQTRVRLSGTYEITGRVATLGAGVIRSKAAKIFDAFCANAAHRLGDC